MNKHHFGLDAAHLHILAMGLMLLDHLWATIVPGGAWMSWLGRLAFPIFAFLLVEGYFHTSNFSKYAKRMLIFALLSEIPFNLVYAGSMVYPFHQNVLWTFLLALYVMKALDWAKRKPLWLAVLLSVAISLAAYGLAFLLMLDYYGCGIAMVLVFYFLRGKSWYLRLAQVVAMFFVNYYLLGTMETQLTLFGYQFSVVQQSVAVFALLPIFLYNGEKGCKSMVFRYACYGFYPLHLLILGILWLYV